MRQTKWTDEALIAEAKKYPTRKALQQANDSAYVTINRRSGLRDIAFEHMTRPFSGKWTAEAIKAEALKYTSKTEFRRHSKGAYERAINTGILDNVCAHMKINRVLWTPAVIKTEALKYTTKAEFRAGSYSAYLKATRLKIINEVCAHMKEVSKNTLRVFPDLPLYTTGIYILYNKGSIVYIGKSTTCIASRLRSHLKKFEFTDITVYEITNQADIHIAEVYLIAKHQPLYNNDGITTDKTTLIINNLDDIITSIIKLNLKEQYAKSKISISN